MTRTLGSALLVAVGVLAFGSAHTASAGRGQAMRHGHGTGSARHARAGGLEETIDLAVVDVSAGAPDKARLSVRTHGLSRQEMRLRIRGASPGVDLALWVEDAAGTMVHVADLRETDPGNQEWRVRSQKGQALPLGVADVAALSGRAVEVRAASEVIATGSLPAVDAAPAVAAKKRAKVRTVLAVPGADATGDSADDGVAVDGAEIRIRRRRGWDEFRVEVEAADAGAALEVWIADAAGTLTLVSTMVEDADGGDVEYRYSVRSDRDTLPLGVASLAELSGRQVEIRTAAGDTVASGFVPQLDDENATDEGNGDRAGDDTDDDDVSGHDADDGDDHVGDDTADDGDGTGADDVDDDGGAED